MGKLLAGQACCKRGSQFKFLPGIIYKKHKITIKNFWSGFIEPHECLVSYRQQSQRKQKRFNLFYCLAYTKGRWPSWRFVKLYILQCNRLWRKPRWIRTKKWPPTSFSTNIGRNHFVQSLFDNISFILGKSLNLSPTESLVFVLVTSTLESTPVKAWF